MNKLASGKDPRGAVIRALKAALAEKDFHNTERMKEIACLLGKAVELSRERRRRLGSAMRCPKNFISQS